MTTLRRDALDAHRYPPETLDALIAAIDVNDVVNLDAILPPAITLDYPADRFVAGFRLSRQLWQEGFVHSDVLAFAGRVRSGETPDADAMHRFKQVRARFKHLRFAFFLYARDHRSPPLLSLVTLVMGELQDALRVRGAGDARRQAARLRWLLAPPLHALLVRETDRLTPSDSDGFRRFTLAQVRGLEPLLARRQVGGHAFHAARKVVSRQVSFHDDMRTLCPAAEIAAEHRTMARALATLNGLMGQFHDRLVAAHAEGSSHYADDVFALPDDIRGRLDALVASYLGTSSS